MADAGGARAGARVIVGDLAQPSVVWGVHGTTGQSKWKCFARRAGLFGAWEAVEWAWLPPGGLSGEHRHTRTEEIYFILRGRGVMTLNGRAREVAAGDLVLTGLGSRHSLRNTGDEGLAWLVVELLGPATSTAYSSHPADRVPVHGNREEDFEMRTAVFNLNQTPDVDPRSVFTGPLDRIRLVTLAPGERLDLQAVDVEHTLFVVDGAGVGVAGEASIPLEHGVSLTLPLGTWASVKAAAEPDQGLRCFIATLATGDVAAVATRAGTVAAGEVPAKSGEKVLPS